MHQHVKPKGVFVTGTDTDVGKTYIGCLIIEVLVKQGIQVHPRKPVESGWQKDVLRTDAGLLMQAAQSSDAIDVICPNPLIEAVSPVRAATLEGTVLTINGLKNQCLNNISTNGFLYVEGAGGFYSPLASDGVNADLAVELDLPIVLVAEDRLGCINQILLTLEAAKKRRLQVQAIILNQRDNKVQVNDNMDNKSDLEEYTETPVFRHSYKGLELSGECTKLIYA